VTDSQLLFAYTTFNDLTSFSGVERDWRSYSY